MVLRVPGAFKVLKDKLANLARGVVQELMVLVECLERLDQRATEGSTDSRGYPVRRDTGASQGQWDPWAPPERTDREVKTARSDREDWLERVVPEVCLDHAAPLDLLALPASLESTGLRVQKETWDPKESQGHLGSRESPAHRVFLDLKAPSDHLVKKDLRADRGCLDYPEPTGLLVILARRVLLERKGRRVRQVRRVPSVTPVLAE